MDQMKCLIKTRKGKKKKTEKVGVEGKIKL